MKGHGESELRPGQINCIPTEHPRHPLLLRYVFTTPVMTGKLDVASYAGAARKKRADK
jgi:hypothetical protein